MRVLKVLVTAGPVYGKLDDNKLVSNRVRGLWACKFAEFLADRGHSVTLLLAATMPPFEERKGIEVLRQDGYESYRDQCVTLAKTHDGAVMAAAVVNWIPAHPVRGKMPTAGYKEGDIIQVPFVLAPRVIQMMKGANPHLNLIGCKMLIGSKYEDLIEAAYSGVLLPARCNAVVANDPTFALRKKWLVYQDRSVQHFYDDFQRFYEALEAVLLDEHYRTVSVPPDDTLAPQVAKAMRVFDEVVNKYRDRFIQRSPSGDRVFGSVAVRVEHPMEDQGWLMSPREKGQMFSAADAVWVKDCDFKGEVGVAGGGKATLNAPLLWRVGNITRADVVLHLHEQDPSLPTLPYAPPGTKRDNNRDLMELCCLVGEHAFFGAKHEGINIEGHGFIKAVRSGI